jgi:acyl dehydratase
MLSPPSTMFGRLRPFVLLLRRLPDGVFVTRRTHPETTMPGNSASASLVGASTQFEKTLSPADVIHFAAFSGDDHPIHTDETLARAAGLDGRIVQGSLLVGLMAGASTKFFRDLDRPALSYGYDRIRFTGQVDLGQRLRVEYTVTRHDLDERKTWADVRVTDDKGRLVAVAQHVSKLLKA